MVLSDRIRKLNKICCDLIVTSSLNEKRDIINNIDEELKDDFQYILEILAGKHKLYYTYTIGQEGELFPGQENMTFREYIAPLFEPFKIANLSDSCILHYKRKCPRFQNFIASIVNRELKKHRTKLSCLPFIKNVPTSNFIVLGNLGTKFL